MIGTTHPQAVQKDGTRKKRRPPKARRRPPSVSPRGAAPCRHGARTQQRRAFARGWGKPGRRGEAGGDDGPWGARGLWTRGVVPDGSKWYARAVFDLSAAVREGGPEGRGAVDWGVEPWRWSRGGGRGGRGASALKGGRGAEGRRVNSNR